VAGTSRVGSGVPSKSMTVLVWPVAAGGDRLEGEVVGGVYSPVSDTPSVITDWRRRSARLGVIDVGRGRIAADQSAGTSRWP
jgi:hypothetical protein